MTSRQIGYLVEAFGPAGCTAEGGHQCPQSGRKRSLIPFNDDNPIIYPDADVWRELTARRKEKYSQMDLASSKPAEQKINKALHDQTELDFVDTPLTDVITYLEDYHKINIAIDHKALEDAGIGTDTQITRTLKDVTLRSGVETDAEGFRLELRDRRRGAS